MGLSYECLGYNSAKGFIKESFPKHIADTIEVVELITRTIRGLI